MKLAGFVGTGVGKLGASVFTVRKGQQVVRQYQPVVSNPNTESQAQVRAVFSLLTKNAKLLAGAFGFTTTGLQTQRNAFVKRNYGVSVMRPQEGDTAALMSYENIVLSDGLESAGSVSASVDDLEATFTVPENDRVRGAVIVTNPRTDAPHVMVFDEMLQSGQTTVDFSELSEFIDVEKVQVTIAWYGVKFAVDAARVAYEQMHSVAQRAANVAFIRSLSQGSAITTRTKTWYPTGA